MVLLDFIAELATEDYLLAPGDPLAEARQNTWHVGASPEQRAEVTADEVAAAFEAVASALGARLRPAAPVTFYVWHDEQVGALKSSVASLGRDELPFGAEYEPVDELAGIVEAFLAERSPGSSRAHAVFPVWVRTIAA